MLDYGFGSYSYVNPVTKITKVKHGIGVNAPYEMLSPIGDIINDPNFIGEILTHLTKVMEGRLPSYVWGCDMALVTSGREISDVEYMAEKEGIVGDFHVDIPTAWLHKMMTDWKKYLEENP